MSEIHLRQSRFTYSTCEPFTKNKQRIQKFKEIKVSRYIYQNELDKACFQHDMVYGDFNGFPRRTASNKVLRDKAFNIAKNPKYDAYQKGLASMVYKFFDKKTSGSGVKNENISGQHSSDFLRQSAKELHKLIIRKFGKQKIHSSFIGTVWSADLADMQLISKFNKGFRFLLPVIDIYSKYASFVTLKDKNVLQLLKIFKNF